VNFDTNMKEIYNLLEPKKYTVLELKNFKGVHLDFEQCVLITQKLVDMELELKKMRVTDFSDSGVPRDIQSEYNILISRLRDGSADPDIKYVEDRIEEIRKEYPNIKLNY